MSTLTSLARARAVATGRAQPIATVRHVHISDRPLVLVPLVMAGEANAPLAALVGDDPRAPRLLVVPQPRNRDQRFAFAADLAAAVLGYIDAFTARTETVDGGYGQQPRERFVDAPQIIVPNPAGIGFARLFGRSTRFRRTGGPYPVPAAVPLLGQWLTFLAERAEYPGSCLLLAATGALGAHWATGQSAVEDLNLAALLGWIDPPPGTTGEQAALRAEDPAIWPPAGPATDPVFDNEVLAPLIEAYAAATGDGPRVAVGPARATPTGPPARATPTGPAAQATPAGPAAWATPAGPAAPAARTALAALENALASQLEPTWRLVWRAVDLLRALPAGARVAGRWDADRDAFTGYAEYLASEAALPQARRDGAVAAAIRLDRLERARARYDAQRALDDPLVLAEYRLSGEAFAGTVVAAEPDRLVSGDGKRRRLRPLVTVATTDPLRLRPDATVYSTDRPGQQGLIMDVYPADGATHVVLELSGGMGRALTPAPGSVPTAGQRVGWTAVTGSYQRGAAFPAREETPWTHGGPPPEYQPSDQDATEEWE